MEQILKDTIEQKWFCEECYENGNCKYQNEFCTNECSLSDESEETHELGFGGQEYEQDDELQEMYLRDL